MAVLSLAAAAAAAARPGPAPRVVIVDDPGLGAFLDIAATGRPVALGDDGEAMLPIEGFAGNVVLRPGAVAAGLNGGLNFGAMTVTDLAAVNEPIPSPAAFLGMQALLAFWDDIDDKDGDLFVEEVASPRGGVLVVQWNVADFDGAGSTLRFQVQAFGGAAADGIQAQLLYRIDGPAPGAGAGATIGYQDGATGFDDVEVSFNQPGAVGDGTVLSLLLAQPGDIDGDGAVGIADLLELLAGWGPCHDCEACPADLDGDCLVSIGDLLGLLAGWDG